MRQFSEELIPQLTIYEQEVFDMAGKTNALTEAKNSVQRRYGAHPDDMPTPPYLQARVVNLLYVMLVFSFEYWKRKRSEEAIFCATVKPLSRCSGIHKTEDFEIKKLIKMLRNSVAHADFSFRGPENLIFHKVDKKGKTTSSIEFSIHEMIEIINVFSRVYISWGNDPEFCDHATKNEGNT